MLDRINHTVETTPEGRRYTIEGKDYILDSVTTNLRVVNKPELNDWRVKHGREESNRLRDEGGEIGTMVHQAGLRLFKGEGYGSFEWSLLGYPTDKDERVRNAVCALDLLRRERPLSPGDAELFVWSEMYRFAGTLDKVEVYKDYADIYDWKTSERIYTTTWLQLAAYAIAFRECYGIPVRRIYPVRLDRGPANERSVKYEAEVFKEGEDIDKAFTAYIYAQELGRYVKSEGGRY